MEEILLRYRHLGASDLHIRANKRLWYRREGDIFSSEEIIREEKIEDFLQRNQKCSKQEESNTGEFDFSYQDKEGRYRINVARGEEGDFLSVRIIQEDLPEFPPEMHRVFEELVTENHGFVLVTGSTGSGKSTSLRFFLEEYNKQYAKKIICLEDPIEYFYQEKKSIFFQREIGRDSKDFSTAIYSSLRQDPDILLIGEIRDAKSLEAALYCAESGHLVFSSLHTGDCVESIRKMVALSSKERQEELRHRLAGCLRWLIAQELVKKKNGKRIAIFEILRNTKAVANMILSARELQLSSVINSSVEQGMCSKEYSRKKYQKE